MPCAKCSTSICSKCANEFVLIPFDETKPEEESNDLKKNGTLSSYCKDCYREVSVLDYSRSYDDYKPSSSNSGSPTTAMTTFLMVHGGGGSRAMFRPHAQELVKKGYRCILMDLPGHGTQVEVPLTLEACVEATSKIYRDCELDGSTTIFVGASLGAYIGFYILDTMPTKSFCGAVMMDCGQNVGPDCSLKARAGVWFLKMATTNMSNKGLVDAMMGVTLKSPAKYKLVESVFGAGMHFQQGAAQTVCMHTVEPAKHIPNYDFPVLFFNGSEDYRDSEDKWLALCKKQELSSLHVFEGGDHFFTHDERFVGDLLERMDVFARKVS